MLVLALALTCHAAARALTVREDHPALHTENGLLTLNGQPFTGEVLGRWPGGAPHTRTGYDAGQRHGIALAWHPGGELAEVRFYTHGGKSGIHRGWHPNGRRSFQLVFNDSGVYHGIIRRWYDSGRPEALFHYENGYEQGLQQGWRENGDPYANFVMKDGRRYGLFNPKLCFGLDENDQIQ